jgi:hypothetical protein
MTTALDITNPFTADHLARLNDIALIFGLTPSPGHRAISFYNCDDPDQITRTLAEDLRSFARACERVFAGVDPFRVELFTPHGEELPVYVTVRWYAAKAVIA